MTITDVRLSAAVQAGQPRVGARKTIAIIGGGFSGAAVAYHLAGNVDVAFQTDIVIFEPRPEIGRGLAYDTADPAHRINVPAARMSLRPDEPEHFAAWLERTNATAEDSQARRPDGALYPRRGMFGAYVADSLKPHIESGAVRHVRSAVTAVRSGAGGWEIEDDTGTRHDATLVVIATTHPPPAPPRALAEALGGHPRFVADPTRPRSLAAIRPDDDVLIVGNGLTSADVVASLTGTGHHGRILSVSRRGLRSRGHASFPQEPFGDFLAPPPTSARELVKRVRNAIRAAEATGLTWHAVIDQVRTQAATFWPGLSITERRRIIRHLRVFWDVHRFRIAPQVEQALDTAIETGRLDIVAGSVRQARIERDRIEGDRIRVTLKLKGSASTVERLFDAVVVTTGPAHGGILDSQGWLRDLRDTGHLRLDPTGLGIDCDGESHALDRNGRPDDSLLISGPLARGRFGELMGLPQVSEHARLVAARIADALIAQRHATGITAP
ncbi:putative NAD(P)/FAD-binding protein YdhS [Rhizobium sp. PP-WC-2G-219]|nr:putative NAD(P)/FAD-binding protein YdhS [Rhizobium sp. PP-WC-2G-219]